MKTRSKFKGYRIVKYNNGLYSVFIGNKSITLYMYKTIKEAKEYISSL